MNDLCTARGRYTLDCYGPWGKRKWSAQSKNLVVNLGLKAMCDVFFLGSGYSAGWFMGLYGGGATNTPTPGDTAAIHPGWTEITIYSQLTRPAATFTPATDASPAVISNSVSRAMFNINTGGVVGGAFLISDATKGGTGGLLFSAADLQAPGDRIVSDGDIVVGTYQFELLAL